MNTQQWKKKYLLNETLAINNTKKHFYFQNNILTFINIWHLESEKSKNQIIMKETIIIKIMRKI